MKGSTKKKMFAGICITLWFYKYLLWILALAKVYSTFEI